MNVRITYPTLGSQLKKLAKLSGKELHVVLMEQALLFARDAQRFTPPFGNAPITEGIKHQIDIGKNAVATQMTRLFQSTQSIRMLQNPQKGRLGKGVVDAIARGDILTAEALLQKAGIRTHGIVDEPTKELHSRWRDRWGRVRTSRPFIVTNNLRLGSLVEQAQKQVGTGKAGWNPAIRGIGGKLKASLGRRISGASISPVLKGHRESGRWSESGSGASTVVTISNTVPYLQKHSAHIMNRAWANRLRNLPKQIRAIEKHIEKQLNSVR